MFEVGFTEIVLIFGLALIVLGPQKLPKLAAQIGRWVGRARAMARQLREQLDQEVNLEETRPQQPAPAPVPPKTESAPTASNPDLPDERPGK
jgi:sec-independent protein translocase protein TatB